MKVLRAICALCVLAALAPACQPAAAQDYPNKLVRMVVPYPPGGGVDGMARPLADRLSGCGISPWSSTTSPGRARSSARSSW